MAGMQDFIPYDEDFIGPSVAFPTSANIATPWVCTLTGGATHVRNNSNMVLTLTSTSEAQIAGLHHGGALAFDIDDLQSIEMRVRINATTFTSGSILVFGLGSAYNATADTVTASAWFRMEGANSTTLVYCETDDDVRNVDDISSGRTLINAYKKFRIDFTNGKSDVRFFIDGDRVAASQTFDMSGYSAGLQPYVQLQKTTGSSADSVLVDYVKVKTKRV
jgi:hypothetical protein